jgi:hypothetical protein
MRRRVRCLRASLVALAFMLVGGDEAIAAPEDYVSCTGRWVGRLDYDDPASTCAQATLAPRREFDVTVRIGPEGYELKAARPTRAIANVQVTWDAPSRTCMARVFFSDGNNDTIAFDLTRSPAGVAVAGATVAQPTKTRRKQCGAEGRGKVSFEPDGAGPAPVVPYVRRILGAYSLAATAWKPDACKLPMPGPPDTFAFVVTIDRRRSDALVVTWKSSDRSTADTTARVLRMTSQATELMIEHEASVRVGGADAKRKTRQILTVDDRGRVTGTAYDELIPADRSQGSCGAKGEITGTRTAAP